MSRKKDQQPQVVTGQAVEGDPLACKIGPQHLVAVLQQKYPTIYDACMGFAAAQAQEQVARQVVAEKDARIAELEAKLDGKAAVKEADTIVQNGVTG